MVEREIISFQWSILYSLLHSDIFPKIGRARRGEPLLHRIVKIIQYALIASREWKIIIHLAVMKNDTRSKWEMHDKRSIRTLPQRKLITLIITRKCLLSFQLWKLSVMRRHSVKWIQIAFWRIKKPRDEVAFETIILGFAHVISLVQ